MAYFALVPGGLVLIAMYPFLVTFLDPSYQVPLNTSVFVILILGFHHFHEVFHKEKTPIFHKDKY